MSSKCKHDAFLTGFMSRAVEQSDQRSGTMAGRVVDILTHSRYFARLLSTAFERKLSNGRRVDAYRHRWPTTFDGVGEKPTPRPFRLHCTRHKPAYATTPSIWWPTTMGHCDGPSCRGAFSEVNKLRAHQRLKGTSGERVAGAGRLNS
ncbi:hypothetical protein ACJJTC_018411 [Scirpophaga incertulas]